jgi:hypothetical protein
MLFRKERLVQLKSIVTFAVPNGKRPIGKLNLPKRVLNLWVNGNHCSQCLSHGLRERNFLKLLQNQKNSPYLCSPLQLEAFETCELKVTKK